MGITIFLGRRLALSSGGRKSSPAVRVAVAAVALSVIVMLCAIAIVMGFKTEITEKVTGFNAHIVISPGYASSDADPNENLLTLTPSLSEILRSKQYITDFALQAAVPAILKTRDDFKGIYLRSLSGNGLENFIDRSVISGQRPVFSSGLENDSIILSRKIASQLNLDVGDKIETYFMADAITVRSLHIAAIYDSHFDSFDDAIGFASLNLVQQMGGGLGSSKGTSIVINVDNFDNVEAYATDLREALVKAYTDGLVYNLYTVTTALQSGASYFQWLGLLDMNVIVVLTLMTIVACVTLVSGMLILMVDKIRFIALMSALGATRRQISKIFMFMAVRIAFRGLLLGNILAVCLLLLQKKTHFIPLDAESYYMDYVPVELSPVAFVILNVAIITIIWIVLLLPSRFAGKAAPARTLANE